MKLDAESKTMLDWYGHGRSGSSGMVGADSPVELQWRRISDWVIQSSCGKYRIEKYAPGQDVLIETFHGYRYRCMRLTFSNWLWQFDTANDPQTARQRCQEDMK